VTFSRFRDTFFGDKAFYAKVLHILIPSVIHISVTNFVQLLDNIMVGSLGTAQMSGVAVTNQLMFVYNMIIFGVLAGAGIFGAQYWGSGDMAGVRDVFRTKIWLSQAVTLVIITLFVSMDEKFISLFLMGQGEAALADAILAQAKDYLYIMLWGLIPFGLSQSYSGTMREAGEMRIPMRAGLLAVMVNLVCNWVLIFGHLGFPAMGVKGAALATVVSRFVEVGALAMAAHRGEMKKIFHGVYRTMRVPIRLLRSIFAKGSPLMVNEFLWSMGMAALTQIYSLRGLIVLGGLNISSTVTNMFNVVLISGGMTVGIIIGQMLGAGEISRARKDIWKLMSFSVLSTGALALVMQVLAPLFPAAFNTEQEVRDLATTFIRTVAVFMPLNAITNTSYYALRSGGRTVITFLFDAAFNWAVVIPITLFLVHGTQLTIAPLYFISQGANILKCGLGVWLVHAGVWAKNIVGEPAN
jgi:putative MATE family efflux protein